MRSVLALALAIGASGGAASVASAQTVGSDRPFRGILEHRGRSGQRQTLDFSFSAVAGYDQDSSEMRQDVLAAPALGQRGRASANLGATVQFVRPGQRLDFVASGASSWRQAPSVTKDGGSITQALTGHSGALGLHARLSRRTTVTVNQAAAYSPAYLVGLYPKLEQVTPGEAPPISADYANGELASISSESLGRVSYGVTRRSSIRIGGAYRRTDFSSSTSARQDVQSHSVQTGYARELSPNVSANLQYEYQSGQVGFVSPAATTGHAVQFGLDYSKSLSASRRAVFRLNLGSHSTAAPTSARTRQLGVVGDASFSFPFSRDWLARASYRRGLAFSPVFPDPVFTDGVTAVVSGAIGLHTGVLLSAAYSSGESTIQGPAANFGTYRGTVQIRYALKTHWALHTEYFFYLYEYRGETLVATSLPTHLQRNGVRIGFAVWMPALGR